MDKGRSPVAFAHALESATPETTYAELSQWVQTLFRFRRLRQGHELGAENQARPGKIEENLASPDLCFHSRARETSTKGLKRHTVGKLVESAFGWSMIHAWLVHGCGESKD